MAKKEIPEPLVQLLANVKYDAYKQFREIAAGKDKSMSQAVREAIDLWIKENK